MINSDGTVDLNYKVNPNNGGIGPLALQPDGKLLLGGSFTSLDVFARSNIARFSSASVASQVLSYNNSTISWQRSGSTPEISRASIDLWTNGVGPVRFIGTRVPGGWQVARPNLPKDCTIRARGFVTGSSSGSSSLSGLDRKYF